MEGQFRISLRVPSPNHPPTPSSRTDTPLVICPILYGNVAHHAKPGNPNGTAGPDSGRIEWCVYVRGSDLRDSLKWISSVTFHLHESYSESVVTIIRAPFCCSRLGWGVFEVRIDVKVLSGEVFTFYHTLAFPDATDPSRSKRQFAEKLDEIVFRLPTDPQAAETIRERLIGTPMQEAFRTDAVLPDWACSILERTGRRMLPPGETVTMLAKAHERSTMKMLEDFEEKLNRALRREEEALAEQQDE